MPMLGALIACDATHPMVSMASHAGIAHDDMRGLRNVRGAAGDAGDADDSTFGTSVAVAEAAEQHL